MDIVQEAFARMSLPQIRSFLLYGTDEYNAEVQPYMETLTRGADPISRRLDDLCPDAAERDEAAADLSKALTAYEYVYMELGMKAGARLIHQLLLADNQPSEAIGKE